MNRLPETNAASHEAAALRRPSSWRGPQSPRFVTGPCFTMYDLHGRAGVALARDSHFFLKVIPGLIISAVVIPTSPETDSSANIPNDCA